jgi:AcrR family transcriptional regulator
MARRSDHSREELAALVIAAARKVTAEEGWRAVTMRRIAGEIGYAPGSIYNAVGDLDEVLLQVNVRTLDGLAQALEAAIAASASKGDVTGTALTTTDTYMRYVAANMNLWTAVLERPPSGTQATPNRYAESRTRLIEIVAGVLAPLFPNAKARRRAVVALWAALQGIASLAAGGNLAFAAADVDPQDIARSIVLRYLTGTEEKRKSGRVSRARNR